MRGRLTIFVLLAGSAVFTVFAYWYFYTSSPVDRRFNQLRRAVPENTVLVAPKVGDFHLEGEPGGTTGKYSDMTGSAVTFTAINIGDHAKAVDELNAPINDCDKLNLHPDAKISYVYAGCPNNHTFAWVNGTHRFEAQSPDLALLIYFVNAYLY
jgi:hypothetical protein